MIIRNEARNQQHPFHVLGLSKLPMVMSALAGGLVISVVIKFQNVTDFDKFLTVGEIIMQPFFSIPSLSSVGIPNETVDVRIIQFLALILITL